MQNIIAANNPEIDVELLMRRIHEEVTRHPPGMTAPTTPANPGSALPLGATATIQPLTTPAKVAALAQKPSYTLRDFLDDHDQDFMISAYRGVLRREPDPSGLSHFLSQLRSGDYSKIEILGRLRFSPEGRRAGVRIKGLLMPFAVQTACRLPLLGYGIAWFNGILRLPVMMKNRQRFEAHTAYWISQQQAIARRIDQINESCDQIQRQTHRLAESKANHPDLDSLRERLQQLTQEKASQQHLAEMHQQIRQQMQEALAHTASRQQLAEIRQQMQEALAHTASQQQLAEIQQQMQETLAHTASQQQLAEIQQQMQEALAHTASQQQLAEIQQQMQEALAHTASQQQLAEIQQQMQAALAHTASQQQLAETKDTLTEIRQQIFDHKRTILDQQRRLGLLLEETRKRLPAPLDSEQLTALLNEDEHLLDAMYATFEDQFRGTRDDIKHRQQIYIPIIHDGQAGTPDAPVLDVGCGRGEWLELLRDHHLSGRGVDLNRVFVQQCLEDDLPVVEQEAVTYLRSLPNHSLGAITGFHIIEHLPTRILIALLDEALRVLRPGGIVIFETPNPGNLLVGSCNFYLDPTHRNPLPAPLSRYLVEARGFVRARIIELHPFDLTQRLTDGPPQWVQMLNQRFFGPQDYAVVAYKA
ncbi:MAG: methyltransferase domain-containing protein [Candidatus Competibacteraceae bacterium]|nr:methyltransferase domain-containing protein [Candidatus Competibacteraceae bacterium]